MDDQRIALEALKNFSVVEGERVVLHIGLVITLYVDEAHTPDKREGLLRCFDSYLSICGNELHKASLPQVKKRWIDLDREALPPAREWVGALSENHPWSLSCTGSKNTADASAYNIEILCSGAWEKSLSYVTATLPFVWLSDNEGGLLELFLEWCEWTSAYHGYAGFGVVASLEANPAINAEPIAYAIAKQFPGIEVDNPVSHARYLKDGIKGVNWLTALGDRWLKKVGGYNRLKEQLADDFALLDYDGGVVVKAGLQPQFGNAEQGDIPEHYRTISRILRPIRASYPVALHHTNSTKLTFDMERTKEWFARLD